MGDFLAILELEQLDRDLYRAAALPAGPRPHLFGGQVAAQALRAATLTVPEDRQPHSLHGYFLRRGSIAGPIILRVERDRDGGSFSARRVVAVQNGEVIFTVSASFHAEEPSGEFQVEIPDDVPGPEAMAASLTGGLAGGPTDVVEVRAVAPNLSGLSGELTPPSRLWVRALGDLPDDKAVHACALTYVTDFGSGFAAAEIAGLSRAGPSLDHCVWFHHSVRLDDWVLIDLWPLRAASARGTYMGTVHDRHGNLGCVLAQEALLRVRPNQTGPPAGKS